MGGKATKRIFIVLLLVAGMFIAVSGKQAALATSITVNTAADPAPNPATGHFSTDGKCSLRAAIDAAQNNSNADDVDCEPRPLHGSHAYTCNVTDLQETGGRYRVSARGQFSLPASARRRWGIEDGGDVEVFDLGEAVVIFPGGPGTARRALAKALDADRYEQLIARIGDPNLRDE
jgi:CSLREA domain-containing protein